MTGRSSKRGAVGAAALLFVVVLVSCSESEDSPAEQSFLVVVEGAIAPQLEDELGQYVETLGAKRVAVHIEPWASGTAEELRALVFDYVDARGIAGALLVGVLPAVWYEQEAFGVQEEFPFDIYFQDRDASWGDADDDGLYDSHTDLELDIFTSRLTGTVEQLKAYFARVERYRTVGPLVDVSAFVFIDNDEWTGGDNSESTPLEGAYSSVEVIQDIGESTRENYLTRLSGRGAEYTHQKIPSSSQVLQFSEPDGRKALSLYDVIEQNLEVSFVNLFSCSASRFTEQSLAEAYTVGTDYGLASIGSTKCGSVFDSTRLHEHLAARMSWGEAYRRWFNEEGKDSDEWHLGIVLMGDPLLALTGDRDRLAP
jgi:hypothetical protein